jgi:type III secretion system low calcium response chaperone LcrH/SycD
MAKTLEKNLEQISALVEGFSSKPSAAEDKLYLLAFCYYEKGHYREAAESFSKLVIVNPYEKNYWCGLGASQQLAKNYQEALSAWCFAALLDQKNPYPHFHAAECLISQGEIKEALLALEEAKKRFPEEDLLLKIETLKIIWTRGEYVIAS